MKPKHRFFVHPVLFAAGLATFLFLTMMAVILLTIGEYIAAAIFFAVGLFFIPQVIQYGKIISIDKEGVCSFFLGKKLLRFQWSELSQVGIAGSRVIRNKDGKKHGTLYLYFSPEPLSEDDLFKMMLHFPPKNIIVLACISQTYNAVRQYWHEQIPSFNAKNTSFD